jgi:arylsulfatase A-like enzyme
MPSFVSQPPNILLIMADQLVPQLTGAYGHPVVQTPHLDQLAAEGVRFDAAYSPCPVCAPARAAMMTGKHTSTNGAWDNAAPWGCDEPTLPHYLTLAGYDTVLSGKMHFVGADQLHGFDRRFTTNVYPADFSWVPVRGEEHASEPSRFSCACRTTIPTNRSGRRASCGICMKMRKSRCRSFPITCKIRIPR